MRHEREDENKNRKKQRKEKDNKLYNHRTDKKTMIVHLKSAVSALDWIVTKSIFQGGIVNLTVMRRPFQSFCSSPRHKKIERKKERKK